jgi:hypothetical protein
MTADTATSGENQHGNRERYPAREARMTIDTATSYEDWHDESRMACETPRITPK